MNNIVRQVLQPLLKNDKIFIPEHFNKVKLDVGLSHNAPHPEVWLSKESDLFVIGFEPSTLCHNNFMNKTIGQKAFKSFFPLKCALSNLEPHFQTFYNTGNDLGCSSLFKPKYFSIIKIEEVPVITLKYFFDLFPWSQISYIDQLKIDAQSSDFDIILGIGDYLNNVVYLTVEYTTHGQYDKEDDSNKFDSYLEKFSFEKISQNSENATYINKNHIDKKSKINFFVFD